MNGIGKKLLGKLHRPAYTGENRCVPCTILNATFAGIIAVGVGLTSPSAAALVLAASGGLIYLRGYIVPGTPALTAALLPANVRRRLGHGTDIVTDGGRLTEAESRFVEIGVLTQRDDGELTIDEDFLADWESRMRELRDDEDAQVEALADLLGTAPERTSIHVVDPVCFGRANDTQIGQWPSRPALVADLTAAPELAERDPEWSGLDFPDQGVLLNSLRAYLETCPSCGGDVEFRREVEPDCCGGTEERFFMECERCDSPIL